MLSSFPEVLEENLLSCLLQLLRASGNCLHEVLLLSSWPAVARQVSVHNLLSVSLPLLVLHQAHLDNPRYSLFKVSWLKTLVSSINPLIPPCHVTWCSWVPEWGCGHLWEVSVCPPQRHFFSWRLWLKTQAVFSVSHASWLHGRRHLL